MLTDAKVKAAKLDEGKGQKKLSDSHGLYLLVNKSGKYWRFDYRYAGKRKTLSIGTYPEIKLKKAREARDSAEKLFIKYTGLPQHIYKPFPSYIWKTPTTSQASYKCNTT